MTREIARASTGGAQHRGRAALWVTLWVRWVADDELRQLLVLVATWPAPMRQVFTLRKVYDLAATDIAHRLGLTESEVEHQLIQAALAVARCADGCPGAGPAESDEDGAP